MFFARKPDDRLEFETLTGIRDIVEFDADLVRKEVSRRVNMEYDWKRRPDILFDHGDHKHCAFSTIPWETVEQFRTVRDLFEKYLDSDPHCIKSVGDFDSLSVYIDANMQLPEEQRLYLKKRSGDLKRLRMALCAAWHQNEFGLRDSRLIASAQQFADALSACGINCSRANVENGKTQVFAPNSVPPTDSVLAALQKLQAVFPDIDAACICATQSAMASIKPRRRPHHQLRPRNFDYYQGITIPGVGWIAPALQSSAEIKQKFEQPGDCVDAPSNWLTREEYDLD
jgi:hypothetical protein